MNDESYFMPVVQRSQKTNVGTILVADIFNNPVKSDYFYFIFYFIYLFVDFH